MSLELHHHYCGSRCAGKRYACVDPDCAYRDEKEECCPACYYGDDKVITVKVEVKRYKELYA